MYIISNVFFDILETRTSTTHKLVKMSISDCKLLKMSVLLCKDNFAKIFIFLMVTFMQLNIWGDFVQRQFSFSNISFNITFRIAGIFIIKQKDNL